MHLSSPTHCRPPFLSVHSRCRRGHSRVFAIGFDLPGSPPAKSVERSAEELHRAASSLLLHQAALRGRPAQAFLSILLHLQKGSPLKLTEHYGELYKELAAEGATSWREYLLDQILHGSDNPFARAAAKLEPTDALLPAVRSDLDIIQKLAVTESTLVGWIRDSVYGLPEAWTIAATSMLRRNSPSPHGTEEGVLKLPEHPPAEVRAPLNPAERAALHAMILELWTWGEGAELLRLYFASYDYGIVSSHRIFKWTGKSLQAQDVLECVRGSHPGDEPGVRHIVNALTDGFLRSNLEDRSTGYDPIIVHGSAGVAYRCATTALAEVMGLSSKSTKNASPQNDSLKSIPDSFNGMRLIILPSARLADVADVAWTMGHHPRVRFVVVCPSLPQQIDPDALEILCGNDGISWPANALFVGCTDKEPVGVPGRVIPVS